MTRSPVQQLELNIRGNPYTFVLFLLLATRYDLDLERALLFTKTSSPRTRGINSGFYASSVVCLFYSS